MPLNSRNNVNLESIRVFFPDADGLMYIDDAGDIHGLSKENNELFVNPLINTYNPVFSENNGNFF